MLVDDVRSDGDVDGHRCIQFRARGHDAQVLVGKRKSLLSERAPGSETTRDAVGERSIHHASRFIDHAERSVIQSALHVFARLSVIAQLEIVDGARSVEGHSVDDSASHGVHDEWIEPDLDRMSAHHQKHRTPVFYRSRDRICDELQILHREKIGQRIEERSKRGARLVRLCKSLDGDLVRPVGDRIGADFGKIERWKLHDRRTLHRCRVDSQRGQR